MYRGSIESRNRHLLGRGAPAARPRTVKSTVLDWRRSAGRRGGEAGRLLLGRGSSGRRRQTACLRGMRLRL